MAEKVLTPENALGSDQLLKVTALLYLKEALLAQEYESCKDLIDAAINLGATQGDIKGVIADYVSNLGRPRNRVKGG